jgi:leader peptidase (prepilin peptidase)/N-methyltransferase
MGQLRDAVLRYRVSVRDRPLRAFAVAFIFVLVEAAVMWRFRAHAPVAAYLYFGVAGILAAESDIRTFRMPNRVLMPSIGIEAALLAVASDVAGRWYPLERAAIAGLLFAGYLLLLDRVFRRRGGLGGADVKAAVLIGLALGWLGWFSLFTGVLLGFLSQLIIGFALQFGGRLSRGQPLPVGPFLFAGACIAILI